MAKQYKKRVLITDWSKVPVLFDVAYAANLLGLTYDHTRKLCVAGIIPAHKIGRNSWRINKNEFMEYVGATNNRYSL